jgi:hypothetical protein
MTVSGKWAGAGIGLAMDENPTTSTSVHYPTEGDGFAVCGGNRSLMAT